MRGDFDEDEDEIALADEPSPNWCPNCGEPREMCQCDSVLDEDEESC